VGNVVGAVFGGIPTQSMEEKVLFWIGVLFSVSAKGRAGDGPLYFSFSGLLAVYIGVSSVAAPTIFQNFNTGHQGSVGCYVPV
jgi:hypothetical protein